MHHDNELMAKVIKGERQAFEEIVLSHRKAAIIFAYSFVADYGIAEDIVQECFVKIYLLRDNYKPTYSFKTYLYSLIRNQCVDYLRANKIRRSIVIEQEGKEKSAEEEYLYEAKYSEITDLFNNLKGDYRTALYLYAINGCSYKEIASVMKKTVPQIKIIIYRARQSLQKSLIEKQ